MNELIYYYFEVLSSIKMYHWQTYNYGNHKNTDEYYKTFLDKMDELIEVYQGIYGRIKLSRSKSILIKNQTKKSCITNIERFTHFLKKWNEKDEGLNQIKDELISLNHRLLYLMTFK
jgi:hypothetical protein